MNGRPKITLTRHTQKWCTTNKPSSFTFQRREKHPQQPPKPWHLQSPFLLSSFLFTSLLLFLLLVLNEAEVVPDQYDERTFCKYDTDASSVYGIAALLLLLISHLVVNGVTKCLCCGKGLGGRSSTCAIFFFIFSWVTFLAAEACLIAGSVRNAYHTKYRGVFGGAQLSCATLRKGVFAAAGALILLSMIGSVLYYWLHSKADTGGWQRHQNEGIGMAASEFPPQSQHQTGDVRKP